MKLIKTKTGHINMDAIAFIEDGTVYFASGQNITPGPEDYERLERAITTLSRHDTSVELRGGEPS